MRSPEEWKPTKFEYKGGRLVASRNPKEVGIGSRMVADVAAHYYDNHLGKHARGKLLDLGCGKAPLYEAYRNFVTESICVDWASSLHKNPHLDVEADLTKPLPFRDEEFDTIILSDVLEHIPVPEQLWREMARILASRGKIIVNVPFFYWIHEAPHDYYRFTEYALRRFVALSGLDLLELEPMGGAPEIMVDFFAKNIMRVPKLGWPIACAAQWVASGVMKTDFMKGVSRATSGNFPLGYFLIAQKA